MSKLLVIFLALSLGQLSLASGSFDGQWASVESGEVTQLLEFEGVVTFTTKSYYTNGAEVNWFFSFKGHDAKPGAILKGRVRSVDGFYSCVFDEDLKAQMQADGSLKISFPILVYHRESKFGRTSRTGYYFEREVDWSDWRWVERIYKFPVETYRLISTECVIDQKNWITHLLKRI